MGRHKKGWFRREDEATEAVADAAPGAVADVSVSDLTEDTPVPDESELTPEAAGCAEDTPVDLPDSVPESQGDVNPLSDAAIVEPLEAFSEAVIVEPLETVSEAPAKEVDWIAAIADSKLGTIVHRHKDRAGCVDWINFSIMDRDLKTIHRLLSLLVRLGATSCWIADDKFRFDTVHEPLVATVFAKLTRHHTSTLGIALSV
jgi:hypothetical protein